MYFYTASVLKNVKANLKRKILNYAACFVKNQFFFLLHHVFQNGDG